MSNTIKNLRVKKNETSLSQVVPIGADAVNVEMTNRRNLQQTIGNIDSRTDGSITNNLTLLSSAIDVLDNIKADTTMIGSPLTAAIASEMIDPNHIYIYTGSETGYNNGHWYYYDGTEWQDGGVYNSFALETDKTLKIQDTAADAKATGDMIKVSESQPSASSNRLWINPDVQQIAVPTMQDFQALVDSVASEYDSTSTYSLADYCIYGYRLYKCSTEITTAEAWNINHWTAVTIMDQSGSGGPGVGSFLYFYINENGDLIQDSNEYVDVTFSIDQNGDLIVSGGSDI